MYRDIEETEHMKLLNFFKCRGTKIQIKSSTLPRQINYLDCIQFTVSRELYVETQTHYINELEVVGDILDHPSIPSCRIAARDRVVK